MAIKDGRNGNSISKKKTFKKGSKMRRYIQIFDEDVQQMRAGYYKKDLYKLNELKIDDTVWAVEAGYEYRSDLISFKFYGTAKYDWLIEDINDIKDPIKDLTIGVKLTIPSESRILTIL